MKRSLLTTTLSVIISLSLGVAILPSVGMAEPLTLRTAYVQSPPKFDQVIVDGKISAKGLCLDIMQAVTACDPDITFVPYTEGETMFLPVLRATSYLEDGTIDTMCGYTKSSEREDTMVFSDVPLYSIGLTFAVRADDDVQIASLQDVLELGSNGMILVKRGGAYESYLQQQVGGKLQIESVTEDRQNLLKLVNKRGRFWAWHALGIMGLSRTEGMQDRIKLLPVTFTTENQYMVFSKQVPASTVERVDRVLKALAENRTLTKIYNKYVE